MEERIDLHVHTAASDGTDSPDWVAMLAHALGLAAVAVTDHDTVAGLEQAAGAGAKLGVEIIPGIELSADYEGQEVHILGYFIDPDDPALQKAIAAASDARRRRNESILTALAADGFRVSPAALSASCPGTPGRPHIADLLVQGGYAESTGDAFDRYLGIGRPYYRPRELMSLEQAAAVIRAAGGVVSLAHPMKYGLDKDGREALVRFARAAGCQAVEAYYSTHTPSQQSELLSLAARYGMAVSGGSDYHGARRPRTQLGSGIGGNLVVPYKILDSLRALRP